MLEDIQEDEANSNIYRRSWSDTNSDVIPASDLTHSIQNLKQRSVSLPDGGVTSFGKIPSLQDVQSTRGGWDRLGLYMKGLPPKSLRNKHNKYRKVLKDHVDKSLEELSMTASKAIISLKSDQQSLPGRSSLQERQYNIMLSSLAEEITAAKVTVQSLGHVQPVAAEDITDGFDTIQEKMAKLITNSQQYGKLKYDENLLNQLDMLQIYAESLVRGREAISREIMEINANINDDKIAIAIARKQEETRSILDEEDPNTNDFDNVVEHTENFLKKLSVGLISRRGSRNNIQEKHEPSNIAASAVQELINLRGMNSQRRVTFSEDVNVDIIDSPDMRWRWKLFADVVKDIWRNILDLLQDLDYPYILLAIRKLLGASLLFAGIYVFVTTFLL